MPEAALPEGVGEGAEVVLQNASTYPEVRPSELRRWLAELLAEIAPAARSLGIRFCGERAMREANRRFRDDDAVTDVLSFPGGSAGAGHHLGDVLVCVPQARRQAAARGHDTARELRVLLLHGLLHCAGYDHESDRGQMDELERELRRRWLTKE